MRRVSSSRMLPSCHVLPLDGISLYNKSELEASQYRKPVMMLDMEIKVNSS